MLKSSYDRIFYLDLLRFISCLAVIMIHTCVNYVVINIGSLDFWIGNILDSLSRFGVPIFVMISGATLLDENYYYSKKKNKKHIKKMIIFFLFWSIVYCSYFQVFKPLYHNMPLNFQEIISKLVIGNFHLWYVPMLCGLYMILPLLRLWIKKCNKKYIEYFIVLSFMFVFLLPQLSTIGSYYSPNFKYLNMIVESLNIKYISGYTIYFILGWYLSNYDIKRTKTIYVLGISSILIEIIMTYVLSIKNNIPTQLYDNMSVNVLLQSTMIFIYTKKHYKKIADTKFLRNIILNITNYSLGIYALHVLYIDVIYAILRKINIIDSYFSIPLVFISSLLLSLATSFFIGKIHCLKKLVS